MNKFVIQILYFSLLPNAKADSMSQFDSIEFSLKEFFLNSSNHHRIDTQFYWKLIETRHVRNVRNKIIISRDFHRLHCQRRYQRRRNQCMFVFIKVQKCKIFITFLLSKLFQQRNSVTQNHRRRVLTRATTKHDRKKRAKPVHPIKVHHFNENQLKMLERRLAKDKRFHFLDTIVVPKVDYANVKPIKLLIRRGDFKSAQAFGMDSFASYRVRVINYVDKLQTQAIKITKATKSKKDKIIAQTVVFEIFNSLLNHFDKYHEHMIKEIKQIDIQKLSHQHKNNQLNENAILQEMRRTLRLYESKVNQSKGLVRRSLAMLYTLQQNGGLEKSKMAQPHHTESHQKIH